MPKISIIIPACNEEDYIEKTLKSIKSQTFKNHEIIVVCNGCTDPTKKIAKKLTKKVINIKERNVSLARNTGAKKASGDLLIFLDADTYFPKNNILEIINSLNPDIATCLGSPDIKKFTFNAYFFFKNFFVKRKKLTTGIIICKKDIFQKVKGFNEELKIKEIREFRKRAKLYGKYTIINEKISTSMRRFERFGFVRLIIFWLRQSIKTKNDYKIIR